MKKVLISILVLFFILAGCTSETAQTTPLRVVAMKGPTAMGMVKMMSDESNDYNFEIVAEIDEVTAKLMSGEADIAALPANVAATLYNNSEGAIKVLAINTLGVLYIVENGDSINDIQDLSSRTIYAAGKGATPEYALRYVLENSGVEDVNIEFKSEQSECVGALLNDENGVALLPEPFVTTSLMANPDLRVALDLNDYYPNVVTGVLVARTSFIQENETAVQEFLSLYESSVDFVNNNLEEAADLVGQYDIVKAEVAKVALPKCHIVYIDAQAMKDKLSSYLNDLYTFNAKSIGEALPLDDFYYGA